jgi:DNA polymerase-3 subunit alpha
LVKAAVEQGVSTLALTNINNTCDAWDFVDFCRQKNIKPILGVEIRNAHKFLYILLAKNNKGFLEINRFLSEYLQAKKEFPERTIFTENVIVIYPVGNIDANTLLTNEFISVQISEINKLFRQNIQDFSKKFLVRQPVTFQNKTYYNVHRLLRAIGENIILSKQQSHDLAGKHETFVPVTKILDAFSMYPAIVTNTMQLFESCSIEFEFHTDKTKKTFSASAKDDRELLEKLSFDGLKRRYGTKNKIAKERVVKELQVINNLKFNSYFLITWDIIRYAKNREFFYIGRGSGANSIVAY